MYKSLVVRIQKVPIIYIWAFIIGLFILVAGFFSSQFFSDIAKAEESNRISDQAMLIATVAHAKDVAMFNGNPSDTLNENYLKIKHQFIDFCNQIPTIRYIYLFGKNNKQEVFFYLDTESDKNRLLSNRKTAIPGELYADAPPDFQKIFESQTPIVLQPYSDKWGSFVSVLVPVFDQKNKLIAGVGVDLETTRWDKIIYYKRMFPIQFSLVFIALIALISIFLRYRLDLKKEVSEMYARFKSLADNSENAMILFSLNYKVIYFNVNATHFANVFLNQPLKIGIHVLDAIKEDQHRVNFNDNIQLLLVQNHIRIQIQFKSKFFSLDYQYVQPNETDVPFIVLTIKDVTDVVNDALKKSSQEVLHKSLLKQYNFATLFMNKELQIMEVNSVFCDRTGLNSMDLMTHSLVEFLDSESVALLQSFLSKSETDSSPKKQLELKFISEFSDAVRPVSVEVVPIQSSLQNAFLLVSFDNAIINQPLLKVKEELRLALLMIDSLPGFTYRCKNDSFWTMTYLSKGFEHITGYSIQDVLFNGRLSFNDLIVPQYRDFLTQKWEQSFIDDSIFENEYELICANGTHKWVLERGYKITDADGNVSELYGYITDISSFKDAYTLLESETNSLKSYIDQAPNGMMQIDADMNIIRANDEMLNLLEYNLDFLHAHKLWFFIHPDLFNNYTVFVKKLFDYGTSSDELMLITKSHTVKYVKLDALKFENNEYILYFVDQTQKYESQKQLLAQDRFLQSILAAMNIPYAIVDCAKNKIIDSNDAFNNRLDGPLKQAIGLEIIPSNENLTLIQKVTNFHTFESIQILQSNDVSNSFLVNAAPIKTGKDEPDKIVVFLFDVSEFAKKIQHIELELQKSNHLLSAKNDFFANISHEIRTPLNAIIGVSELLKNEISDKNHRAYLDVVKDASLNLISLVNTILDYSKIEAGKVDLVLEPFYPENLLNSLAILFSPLADKKGLLFQVSIDLDCIKSLVSDEVRIRQIVINLIGNALKFTNSGTVSVSMSIQMNESKPWFVVAVSDTGIGIPSDKIDFIFESFTQLEVDSVDKKSGTGLGLLICNRIIKLLNGKIEVKSQLGIGSTFEVKIPVDFDLTQPLLFDNVIANDRTALLVVTNDNERTYIKKILTDLGLRVAACKNGIEALQITSEMTQNQTSLDFAFIDYDINAITSSEVVQAIDAKNQGKTMFFVLAKKADFKTTQTINSLTEVSNVLVKPLLPSAIIRALQIEKLNEAPTKNPIDFVQLPTDMRILVAEDDAVNMLIIKEILSFANAQVVQSYDGQDAYVKFLSHRPHLIFMDIHMPIMDGFEVTALIRNYQIENPNFVKPYIVALTADQLKNKKEDYSALGFNDYISKPYKLKDVENCLIQYLNQK